MTPLPSRAWIVAAALCASAWSWIDSPAPNVEAGNRAFAAGRYREALAGYQRALRRGGEYGLHLNRGLALYQLAARAEGREREILFGSAETALAYASKAERGALRSQAFAALGTLYLRRGEIDESLSAYRRALIADPRNDIARNNLEIALARRADAETSAGQGTDGGERASSTTGDGAETAQVPDDGEDGASAPAGTAAEGGEAPAIGSGDAPELVGGDLDRKLDALERRSQVLRRKLFMPTDESGGQQW